MQLRDVNCNVKANKGNVISKNAGSKPSIGSWLLCCGLFLLLFCSARPSIAQEKTKDHADGPKPKVELSPRVQAERQNKSAIISSRTEGDDYAVKVKMRRIKRFQLKMAKRAQGRAMARRERQRMMQLQSVIVRDAQRGGALTQTDKAVGGAIKHVKGASSSKGRTLPRKQYKDMLKLHSKVQASTNKGAGDDQRGATKRAIAAESSAEMAYRSTGRTMNRPMRQRMMAFQNSLLQIIKGDDFITPQVRKWEAAERNNEFANFAEGDATSNAQKRFEAAERSVEFATFQGGPVGQIDNQDVRRANRAQKSAEISNYSGDQIESHNEIEYFEADQSRRHAYATKGNTINRLDYKEMLAEKSSKMAQAQPGNTMTKPDYKAMVQAKSKKLAEATKGNAMVRPERLAMMRKKSKTVAEAEKGNTMVRPEHLALMRKKAKTVAEAEKGNTMVRPERLAMMRKKSKTVAEAEKGNTMIRQEHLALMRKKAKTMGEATKGNTLIARDHEALMKKKSGKISDIGNAGYLNTKAEKDLVLQRLLHPNAYLPNNPKDKSNREREKSKTIASFNGKFSRKDNKNVLAHNSAIAMNAKNDVKSYSQLDNARRKGARRLARDKKRFLPQFLRKKEQKPKFAEVEKGIWYD